MDTVTSAEHAASRRVERDAVSEHERCADRPEEGIVLDGASFGYRSGVVLEEVTLRLTPGSITYLIGPNGSGKSTLLKGLAGLIQPISGEVTVHCRPAKSHQGRTAFVVQFPSSHNKVPISVREVVAMGRYPLLGLLRRPTKTDREAVNDALHRLGLGALANRPLHELSGGQAKRAHIAQAIAQESDVLLLDEPMGALDPPSREMVNAVIAQERDLGRTVIVTTHELSEAAMGDSVLVLRNKPVAFGPPSEVLVPEVLAEAYGARVLRLDSGAMLLDDGPHHH